MTILAEVRRAGRINQAAQLFLRLHIYRARRKQKTAKPPDLILRGKAAHDSAKSGVDGVEVKSTKHSNANVDFHGARAQWVTVFVWEVDVETEPAFHRAPLRFTQVYLSRVSESDFRKNARNTEIGTRTASLHAKGLEQMRRNWIYLDKTPSRRSTAKPPKAGSPSRRARKTSR